MSQTYTGGCLCGAIRYRAQGEPFHETHCHCETCRRASGAAMVSWLSFKRLEFTLEQGEPRWYTSSAQAERGFCGNCGTPLFFRTFAGDELDITICSLDQPEAIQPQDHCWTRSQLSWVKLADGLPRYSASRPEPTSA